MHRYARFVSVVKIVKHADLLPLEKMQKLAELVQLVKIVQLAETVGTILQENDWMNWLNELIEWISSYLKEHPFRALIDGWVRKWQSWERYNHSYSGNKQKKYGWKLEVSQNIHSANLEKKR